MLDKDRKRIVIADATGYLGRYLVKVAHSRGYRVRALVRSVARLGDALREGSLRWTIIRPSGFFNDMREILVMAKRGRVWIPGGAGRFNPIHGADLAEVRLDTVGNPNAYGREIPAGGPDCLSMREIGELAFEAIGKRPRNRTIPRWVLTAAGTVIRPFNVNLASLVLMMSALAGADFCCDAYGTHRLRDFFQEAAGEDAGDLEVRR